MAPKKKGPSMLTQQQRKLQMQKIAKGGPQLSGTKGVGSKPAAAPKATSKSMAQANPTRLPNSARAGDNLPSRGASQLRTPRAKAAPSKPIGTGGGGISKPSGSSMKADAKSWQRLNQTASAKSAKAAEPRPRTPAPGTGNVERQAIERGRAAREAQRRATREAKLAKGNYGKLAGTAAKMAGNAAKALLGTKLGRGSAHIMAVKEGLTARNTADGTLTAAAKRGDYRPSRFTNARAAAFKKASAIKGSPVVGPRKASSGGSAASSFDSSFAAARKAGKSTFTWRGKKYNTKLKGE